MPLYEFACEECDHPHEALIRSSSEMESIQCPQCGSKKLVRLISLPSKPSSSSEESSPCLTNGPPCGAPWCRR